MSDKRCYYDVLSVQRDASSDDIRKAYRQAALKYHPDRNPGDAEAESRFKEATQAFTVLSDDDKRARYERFGHAGVDGSAPDVGGDMFSHFQDIFSEFFGGSRGGQGRRRNGPSRGHDLRVQQRITLKDSITGCKREVPLRTPAPCETCEGSGAKPGTKRKQCAACGGAGQVSSARGFVMFTQTCQECAGEGSVVKSRCEACGGQGQVEKSRKVVVSFPAGIDAGQRLRVPGQGLPGTQGGPPGDLFVDVELSNDAAWERDGIDLITRERISVTEATLGVTREVTLPDDTKVEIEIPAGTQPGEVVTTRGRGVPRIDGRGRGALHVVIQVSIPKAVSPKARELLVALETELADAASPDVVSGDRPTKAKSA